MAGRTRIALLAVLLTACAWPAGAVDLEELKRLARKDASEQVKKEAEDKAAEARPAVPIAGNQVLSGSASPMQKLARGIEEAHAAAPNKWYQAAKVEDITPPGDDQRKIYKITGVLGEYCLRYPDKNKANQGSAYVGAPLLGACPHMF